MTSVTSENITEQKSGNAPVEVADIMRLIKAANPPVMFNQKMVISNQMALSRH